MLYGENLVIENNEPVIFSELNLWVNNEVHWLADIVNKKTGLFVESGLESYQNYYLEFIHQLKALQEFVKYSKFKRSWDWVTLVHQMLSKTVPLAWHSSASYRLSESFSLGNINSTSAIAGNMHDFRYVWLFYGAILLLLLIMFGFEITCFRVYRSFLLYYAERS